VVDKILVLTTQEVVEVEMVLEVLLAQEDQELSLLHILQHSTHFRQSVLDYLMMFQVEDQVIECTDSMVDLDQFNGKHKYIIIKEVLNGTLCFY
jgi:hypothetical protein